MGRNQSKSASAVRSLNVSRFIAKTIASPPRQIAYAATANVSTADSARGHGGLELKCGTTPWVRGGRLRVAQRNVDANNEGHSKASEAKTVFPGYKNLRISRFA